jgi:hypothetical protein
MFGLDAVVLVVAALLALAIEFVLVLMAVALVDAPPQTWLKSLLATVAAFAGWLGGGALAFALLGLTDGNPFGSESLTRPLLGVAALLAAMLVVPAALYVPLLGVSPKKSAVAAVLQLLLRLFVYVLIAAVVAVVLALIQILRRSEPPPPRALLAAPAGAVARADAPAGLLPGFPRPRGWGRVET